MNIKQTPENNILTKLITNTIHTPCGHYSKTIQQKTTYTTEQKPSALELKQLSDMNKTKAFN